MQSLITFNAEPNDSPDASQVSYQSPIDSIWMRLAHNPGADSIETKIALLAKLVVLMHKQLLSRQEGPP